MKSPKLKERDIERTCSDLLAYDGWHVFHFEQQFSEKKQMSVGEPGMPDMLCIRYDDNPTHQELAEVLWIELKSINGKVSQAQKDWHTLERKRGALVWVAGQEFEPSIEGFTAHYAASGLQRR